MDGPDSTDPLNTLDDVIKHYGIKGMRWGVRKKSSSATDSEDTKNLDSYKARVKVGGTRALSTKELQDLVTRMNLEQQYSKMNPTASKKAGKFISNTLLNVGKQQVTKVATEVATKQLASILKK